MHEEGKGESGMGKREMWAGCLKRVNVLVHFNQMSRRSEWRVVTPQRRCGRDQRKKKMEKLCKRNATLSRRQRKRYKAWRVEIKEQEAEKEKSRLNNSGG
jgi:hypothetical protein